MKQRIRALVAGILFALALFGIAAADQLNDGIAGFHSGDYAIEMRLLGPLAGQGLSLRDVPRVNR